jgi:hypothetical protein
LKHLLIACALISLPLTCDPAGAIGECEDFLIYEQLPSPTPASSALICDGSGGVLTPAVETVIARWLTADGSVPDVTITFEGKGIDPAPHATVVWQGANVLDSPFAYEARLELPEEFSGIVTATRWVGGEAVEHAGATKL